MSTSPDLVRRSIGLIAVLVTSGVLWLVSRWLRGAGTAGHDKDSGTTAPDKITAWFTVIAGLVMFAAGVFAAVAAARERVFQAEHAFLAAFVMLLGGACAGFMAPSLSRRQAVHWTDAGMEGPARTFGPTLGSERTQIAWSDIARCGSTPTGYWYVEARDGRRIFWSYLYRGNNALSAALRRRCPDLQLPSGAG